jgi:hypothetical protein
MATPNSITMHLTDTDWSTQFSIPISLSSPFEIKQSVGLEPHVFAVVFHDKFKAQYDDFISIVAANQPTPADTFPACKFEITTSDGTPTGSRTVEWAGWYLLGIVQSDLNDDLWIAQVADIRGVLEYGKRSAKYNLKFEDGGIDEDSFMPDPSGGMGPDVPWQLDHYVNDVIDNMGYAIDYAFDNPKYMSAANALRITEVIPNNLGNTDRTGMGGFVAGSLKETLGPLLKHYGFTLIVGIDGKLYLTDRTTERTDLSALLDVATSGSFYGERDVVASRPQNVTLVFQALREFAMEISTTISPGSIMFLTNVMRASDDVTAIRPTYRWVTVGEFGANGWGTRPLPKRFSSPTLTEGYIGDNYFKEERLPRPVDAAGQQTSNSAEVEYIENEISATWRRVFRVESEAGKRLWSRVRLGRLKADGGTEQGENVFCDYTIVKRRGRLVEVLSPGSRPGPVMADMIMSESYRFSSNRTFPGTQPAPFKSFFTGDGKEMLIALEPTIHNNLVTRDIIIGTMLEPLSLGGLIDLHRDTEDDPNTPLRATITKQLGRMGAGYFVRIIASGTPVRPPAYLPNLQLREHRITKPAFSTGGIGDLVLPAEGVSAVFAFTAAQLSRPSLSGPAAAPGDELATELLNAADLDEIAEMVTAEVVESYNKQTMGAIRVGGIQPLVDGIEAGGECNEMSVQVGMEPGKIYSITTNYSIKPGQIELMFKRKDYNKDNIKILV